MKLPPFGSIGSVTREAMETLPPAMKIEGILILRELGCRPAEIEKRTGVSRDEARILFARHKPFPVGGSNVGE